MNSYLLFFPNATSQSKATFQAVGLEKIAGNEKWFTSPVTPSDEPGLFCTWGDPRNPSNGVAVVYDPARQTWRKMPGGYWLGVQNDRKPNPAGLARPSSIKGYAMPMGDGNEYVLPNVMQLPAVYDIDETGDEVRRTRDEWRHIEDRAMWALGTLADHFHKGVLLPEKLCRMYVAEMLSVNYRLVPEMVYALGLLDSDCWIGAMGATVDREKLLNLKTEINAGESAARTS
jgi:hypothetical protein